MQDLSVTQEFMLCAMNEKGKIFGFDIEKLTCMVASGLLELQMDKCIELKKKHVRVIRSLPEEKAYLKPLYNFIDQPKPVKVEKIVEDYSFSNKKLRELVEATGNSLAKKGLVTISETGIITKKKSFIPKKEAVHNVIDMIRSELFENVEITEDIACLVVLLEKSKIIKRYFSPFEQKEIRQKIKELMNSEAGKLIKDMIDHIENLIATMTVLTTMYTQ